MTAENVTMREVSEMLLKEVKNLPREEMLFVLRSLGAFANQPYAFRPGQRVKFRSQYGMDIEGTIVKVNRKSIKVSAYIGRGGMKLQYPVQWAVSPSLLVSLE